MVESLLDTTPGEWWLKGSTLKLIENTESEFAQELKGRLENVLTQSSQDVVALFDTIMNHSNNITASGESVSSHTPSESTRQGLNIWYAMVFWLLEEWWLGENFYRSSWETTHPGSVLQFPYPLRIQKREWVNFVQRLGLEKIEITGCTTAQPNVVIPIQLL